MIVKPEAMGKRAGEKGQQPDPAEKKDAGRFRDEATHRAKTAGQPANQPVSPRTHGQEREWTNYQARKKRTKRPGLDSPLSGSLGKSKPSAGPQALERSVLRSSQKLTMTNALKDYASRQILLPRTDQRKRRTRTEQPNPGRP